MAAATAVIGGIGLAISAGTTAMSFAQAANQQKNIRNAQAKASEAMQAARNKLEVNYYDQLSVMNYDRERLAGLSSGAQLIEAGRESDRGAAATAGRVQAMQNEQQAAISAEQNKQLIEIERMKAMEDSRLRDVNVQLDLGEVEGLQRLKSDEQQALGASIAQGFQGLSTMANQAEKMFELYPSTGNKKYSTDFKQVQNNNLKNMNVVGGGMSSASNAPSFSSSDWSKLNSPTDASGYFPSLEKAFSNQGYLNQFDYTNTPYNFSGVYNLQNNPLDWKKIKF